jgi:murein DD-endopeptidase MepM/ murein hydrolase activator NlpD
MAVVAAAPTDAIRVSVAARAVQPGELVVLTITTSKPLDTLEVKAFDHEQPVFRVAPAVWRALVGIDLDVKPGTYSASIGGTQYPLRVRPKQFRTRTLKVDEAFLNPPVSERPRIDREAAEMAGLWKSAGPDRLWSGPFVRPVPDAANSAFGTRSIYNGGEHRNVHTGADFMSAAGTPIHAPNAGRIAIAGDLYFTGNTVVIDHGLGVYSMLAHMSKLSVRQGDIVQAGQVVGLVGATGRVTGPHLHWAMRLGGARVDPLAVLALLGDAGHD